jgi:AcrR family transcriptional regulator
VPAGKLSERARREENSVALPEPAARRTRRQLSAEATRRKLLSAGIEQFSRRPYSEVTVGDIAGAAGVSHGLLAHHFPGKHGLYLEVLQEADAQLRLAQATDPGAPPGTRIRGRLLGHLDYLGRHPDLALNLILPGAAAGPEAWEAFEAARWQGIGELCALLGLDHERPAVRLAMRSYVGSSDQLAVQWLSTGRPCSSEQVVDALLDLLAGALRSARRLDPTVEVAGALRTLGRHDGDTS